MEATMTPSAFGDRLRQLRQEAGWTLAELAERAGVNLGTIHRIESGHRPNPTWETVVALSAALGVPTDAFLAVGEESTPDRPGDEPPTVRRTGKKK
ncbi:MAG: helix-turn-helix domain-containing protein [Bacteroidales bacterium]|nr:helix-turn-helix domain-containing protein [Bacteroidales bacterium]